MNYLATSTLTKQQKEEIKDLWDNEYPENLWLESLKDFELYLSGLSDAQHLLLNDENGKVRGWFCDFNRENERWFAMILSSGLHGQGVGSKLLELAQTKHQKLNGWVIDQQDYQKQNGQLYRSPLNFYLKNGFIILPNVRLESDKLSAVKIQWSK